MAKIITARMELAEMKDVADKLGRYAKRLARAQRKNPNKETTKAAIDAHRVYCAAVSQYNAAVVHFLAHN